MLMALTRLSRSADLAALRLDRQQFKSEGVIFLPAAPAKRSSYKTLREIFLSLFSSQCKFMSYRNFETV